MKLIKKCPVCDSDSFSQDAEPVFTEKCCSQVYRCEKGHVWKVKTYFRGTKRSETEIINGGDRDESV